MMGDDYVYTLPVTSAHSTLQEVLNNRAGSLPATLPYQPLRWTSITTFVEQRTHTRSALYGNEVAAEPVNLPKAPSGPRVGKEVLQENGG